MKGVKIISKEVDEYSGTMEIKVKAPVNILSKIGSDIEKTDKNDEFGGWFYL